MTQASEPISTSANAGATTRPFYRYYVLVMLMVTYVVSYMDRYIFAILLEDIKEEFAFSDLQLGFLGGFAFACLYATLAVPIAMFADRSHRMRIISIAVAVWSAMTALCGVAVNFWTLFFARVGVGVGEAGGR